MLRAYFGDFTTGRLTRLPFLGFLLLLSVLFVLYGLGIAFGLGAAEHLLRGDLPAAQADLLEHLGLPAIVLLGLFVLAFALAKWNLIAKRIRDMGLPGWWVLLVIVLADAGLASAMHAGGESMGRALPIHGLIGVIISFGLLLIPSGLFARTPRDAHSPTGRPIAHADARA